MLDWSRGLGKLGHEFGVDWGRVFVFVAHERIQVLRVRQELDFAPDVARGCNLRQNARN